MRPGIIVKQRFYAPGEGYSGYLGYINRKEAVKPNAGYLRYMDNPLKGAELFTMGGDSMTPSQKKDLWNQFKKAEENGSLMWDTIISFDNEWLARNGLFDLETGESDDTALKDYIRSGITRMLKNEGLEDTAVWAGALHHNTDNLHAHIAITEPKPTRENVTYRTLRIPKSWLLDHAMMDEGRYRNITPGKFTTAGKNKLYRSILNNVKKEAASETGRPFFCKQSMRFDAKGNLEISVGPTVTGLPPEFRVIRTFQGPEGKFSQKSIKTCKGTVANLIMKEKETNLKINNIIRQGFVAALPEQVGKDKDLSEMLSALQEGLKRSGAQRGKWNYGNHALDAYRPQIDAVSDYFLKTYGKDLKKQFDRDVKNLADNYKIAYGGAQGGHSFIDTKNADLYKRLGNAVLGELKRTPGENTGDDPDSSGLHHHRSRLLTDGYARPDAISVFDPAIWEAERLKKRTLNALMREANRENRENMRAYDQLQQEIEQQMGR